MAFLVSLPPTAVLSGGSPAPLSCVLHAVAVRISLTPPAPPKSLPTIPALIPLLPSCSTKCFWLRSLPCLLSPYSTSSLLPHCLPGFFPVPFLSRFAGCMLVLSLSTLSLLPPPLHRSSLLLRTYSSPLFCRPHPRRPSGSCCRSPCPTPLPPAPAADIACKDEDVGNRTGVGETHWSVAGGSAPRPPSLWWGTT